MAQPLSLISLPIDILDNTLFSFFNEKDVILFGRVCRGWHQFTSREKVWENLFKKRFIFTESLKNLIKIDGKTWKQLFIEHYRQVQLIKNPSISTTSYHLSTSTSRMLKSQDSEHITYVPGRFTRVIIRTRQYYQDPPSIQIINPISQKIIKQFYLVEPINSQNISQAHIQEDKLILGYLNGKVSVWNTFGQCLHVYHPHRGSVLAIQANTKYIISGSEDQTIHACSLSDKTTKTLHEHTGRVTCLRLFNERILISGSSDKTIKKWDLINFQVSVTWTTHQAAISCLKTLGPLVASADLNGMICIHNSETNACLRKMSQLGPIKDLHWDLYQLVSIAHTGRIYFWDLNTGICLNTLKIEHPERSTQYRINCRNNTIVKSTAQAISCIHLNNSNNADSIWNTICNFFNFPASR